MSCFAFENSLAAKGIGAGNYPAGKQGNVQMETYHLNNRVAHPAHSVEEPETSC